MNRRVKQVAVTLENRIGSLALFLLVGQMSLSCNAQETSSSNRLRSPEAEMCEHFLGEFERGNKEEAVSAAYCLTKGVGVKRDLQRAEAILSGAMESGDPDAGAKLGVLIIFEAKDEERYSYALELLSDHAATLRPGADFPLFVASIAGLGTEANVQGALSWLRRSESNGGVPVASMLLVAANSLGLFGMSPDEVAAATHWERYLEQLGSRSAALVSFYCAQYENDSFLTEYVLSREELMQLVKECSERAAFL